VTARIIVMDTLRMQMIFVDDRMKMHRDVYETQLPHTLVPEAPHSKLEVSKITSNELARLLSADTYADTKLTATEKLRRMLKAGAHLDMHYDYYMSVLQHEHVNYINRFYTGTALSSAGFSNDFDLFLNK
jgi:hypothetical protein